MPGDEGPNPHSDPTIHTRADEWGDIGGQEGSIGGAPSIYSGMTAEVVAHLKECVGKQGPAPAAHNAGRSSALAEF